MAFFTLTPKQDYEKALEFKKKYVDSYNINSKYRDKWHEHLKKAAQGDIPEAIADYGEVLSANYTVFTQEALFYLKKAADLNQEKGILGYGIYLAKENKTNDALNYFERLPITKNLTHHILPLIKEDYPKIIHVLESAYPDLTELSYEYKMLLLKAYQETKQDQKEHDFLIKIYNPENGTYASDLVNYYIRHNEMEKAFEIDYNSVNKAAHSYHSKELMKYVRYPNLAPKVYNYYASKFYTYKINNVGLITVQTDVSHITKDTMYYAECLGDCWYYGYGTPKNVPMAITIYKQLVDMNASIEKKLILGKYYYSQKNYTEASKYLSTYPASNLPASTYANLDKEVYVEKAKTFFETKDYVKAFDYLNKALPQANDYPFIYDHLARCFINGWGTTVNDAKGFDYAKKAADLNFPEGLHLFGFCYAMGRGVPKDEKKALEIYIDCEAKYHLPQTQRNIGILYATGQAGLTKDLYKAREWFTKSAKQNSALGKDSLTWVNRQIHLEFEGPEAPCRESIPL